MDEQLKKAVTQLLKKDFSLDWICNSLNLKREDVLKAFSNDKKGKPSVITKELKQLKTLNRLQIKETKAKFKQAIINRVIETYKNYPELSVKEKAIKAGIEFSRFTNISHKLGLKQPQYIPPLEKRKQKQAIRDMYSKGIYTYQAVADKFGITRERVRQIVSDIYTEFKAQGKTHKIVKKVLCGKNSPSYKKSLENYNDMINVFKIAKIHYNKSILNLNEITIAYHNLYGKKKKIKPSHLIWASLYKYINNNELKENGVEIKRIDKNKYTLLIDKPLNKEEIPMIENLFTVSESEAKKLKLSSYTINIYRSMEFLRVFWIALKDYNKDKLTLNELTTAYYNLYGAKNSAKVLTRKQISTKLHNIRHRENCSYIENVKNAKGLYRLTEAGKDYAAKMFK